MLNSIFLSSLVIWIKPVIGVGFASAIVSFALGFVDFKLVGSYFKFLSKQLSVSKIPKLQNIYLFLEITTLKQNLTLQITLYIRQIKSFL